jgi:hypothetical protein
MAENGTAVEEGDVEEVGKPEVEEAQTRAFSFTGVRVTARSV